MNVLFLMKTFGIGGQESVTKELANAMGDRGHNVVIASFAIPQADVSQVIHSPRVKFITLNLPFRYNKRTADIIRKIFISESIEIVINQWGLPFVPAMIFHYATKGLNIKLISVYHHDPQTNTRVKAVDLRLELCRNPILTFILKLKRFLYSFVTKRSMIYVYRHSDAYVLLSKSFISPFMKSIGAIDTTKIYAIPNPLTINSNCYRYSVVTKESTLLYVGRLENTQKRVDRVIDVWSRIESVFSNWNLQIVGDGPDRTYLQSISKGCNQIVFKGFANPIDYYMTASILLLTSEYEGFGLVIIEAMRFGVVPVVYGSYSAVYDIIEDGVDGIIIPKTDEGFNSSVMAEKIMSLMNDSDKLNAMALAAIEKSKNYSIDIIYNQWMEVFQKILKNGKN